MTFGPADTQRFLNVSVSNDADIESQESFNLSIQLGRAAVRIGIRPGDPSETVVVINDDDEGTKRVILFSCYFPSFFKISNIC